jgi:hypothetical protein
VSEVEAMDEEREQAGAPARPEARRAPETTRGSWDFTLMVGTVLLLGALGVQSLAGTLYAWWAQRTTEGWTQGPGYAAFVGTMNAIAGPLVALLVVAIGLCVPKRLFARRMLLGVSAAMVAGGAVAWLVTGSVSAGLGTYLVAAGLLQLAVVAMTLVRGGGLAYLTEGRGRRTGSGLLHLGFIVSCLVAVSLQDSPLMLPVCLLGALLLAVGSAMSFYARG